MRQMRSSIIRRGFVHQALHAPQDDLQRWLKPWRSHKPKPVTWAQFGKYEFPQPWRLQDIFKRWGNFWVFRALTPSTRCFTVCREETHAAQVSKDNGCAVNPRRLVGAEPVASNQTVLIFGQFWSYPHPQSKSKLNFSMAAATILDVAPGKNGWNLFKWLR